MRLDFTRKEVEKLFDEKRFDEIKGLLKYTFSEMAASAIIGFFENNKNRESYSRIEMKKYLVNQVMQGVRMHNNQEELQSFFPYIQKRKIFGRKISERLTEDEAYHLKQNKKSIYLCKKKYNGKLSYNTYNILKKIYDYDKETLYTGIHRTDSDIDDIFEKGLCFKDTADFNNHIQIEHNFDEMLFNISLCEEYKHSTGCFIVKVPKGAVDNKEEPIFYTAESKIYLNPKYVVMHVPVVKKMILTPELNREMNLVNSTLFEGDSLLAKKRAF